MELCQEGVLQKSVLLREQVYVFVTWPWDCKSELLGMEHSKSLRSQCSVPRSQIPGPRSQNPSFQFPDPSSQMAAPRSQISVGHLPGHRLPDAPRMLRGCSPDLAGWHALFWGRRLAGWIQEAT